MDESAIKGIVNIAIKKYLRQATIDIQPFIDILPCIGWGNKFKFDVEDQYLSLETFPIAEGTDLSECFSLENMKD